MRQTALQTGIVSYAGLTRQALFAMAREAVGEPEIPPRFASFLPLFPFELIQNMDYFGPAPSSRQPVNRLGFSVDPVEYFRKLYEQLPQLFAGENRARCFDYEGRFVGRGIVTVDAVWVAMFPQYKAFQGEKLALHMLGGGSQAVAAPESLAVRGGGVLSTLENTMQVRARAQLYGQYVHSRVAAGETYDAEQFGADFARANGYLNPYIGQAELGRTLQELAIYRGLQDDSAGELFTESARRGERLRQYTPNRYACDAFEPTAVTRHTARLAQLTDDDFVSDLWFPYEELAAYLDRDLGGLDVGRLCRSYQIAPSYDPATGGGRYPARLRVVVIRDRDVELLGGAALNNPAYGDGMSPSGELCRTLYLPGSAELLRQRKLSLEAHELPLVNTAVEWRVYARMLAQAALQEHKGKLVDALYRREAALSQLVPGSRGYEEFKAALDARAFDLHRLMAAEQRRGRNGSVSGYDADIDYLRRKSEDREGVPEGEEAPIDFAIDGLRESSIESGYAMRGALIRAEYADWRLSVPQEEDEPEEPEADEAEALDEPAPTEASDEAPAEPTAESSTETDEASVESSDEPSPESNDEPSPEPDPAEPDDKASDEPIVEPSPETGEESDEPPLEPGDEESDEPTADSSIEPSHEPCDEASPEASPEPEAPAAHAHAPRIPILAPLSHDGSMSKLAYVERRTSQTLEVYEPPRMANLVQLKRDLEAREEREEQHVASRSMREMLGRAPMDPAAEPPRAANPGGLAAVAPVEAEPLPVEPLPAEPTSPMRGELPFFQRPAFGEHLLGERFALNPYQPRIDVATRLRAHTFTRRAEQPAPAPYAAPAFVPKSYDPVTFAPKPIEGAEQVIEALQPTPPPKEKPAPRPAVRHSALPSAGATPSGPLELPAWASRGKGAERRDSGKKP